MSFIFRKKNTKYKRILLLLLCFYAEKHSIAGTDLAAIRASILPSISVTANAIGNNQVLFRVTGAYPIYSNGVWVWCKNGSYTWNYTGNGYGAYMFIRNTSTRPALRLIADDGSTYSLRLEQLSQSYEGVENHGKTCTPGSSVDLGYAGKADTEFTLNMNDYPLIVGKNVRLVANVSVGQWLSTRGTTNAVLNTSDLAAIPTTWDKEVSSGQFLVQKPVFCSFDTRNIEFNYGTIPAEQWNGNSLTNMMQITCDGATTITATMQSVQLSLLGATSLLQMSRDNINWNNSKEINLKLNSGSTIPLYIRSTLSGHPNLGSDSASTVLIINYM